MRREARLTPDMLAIIAGLERFLASTDDQGRQPCSAKCGVYAFYDYDGEPIYVGQTYENLRTRMRRHLTGQRSDAVAKHVLDPLEVARVEVWPFWDLERADVDTRRRTLDRAESTVYSRLASEAKVSKLLNEAMPLPTDPIELPPSHSGYIVNDELLARLGHSDERIARRAATIANLAQVIRERDVSLGLRRTLVTQAQRLELIARQRFDEVAGAMPPDRVIEELAQSTDDESTE